MDDDVIMPLLARTAAVPFAHRLTTFRPRPYPSRTAASFHAIAMSS